MHHWHKRIKILSKAAFIGVLIFVLTPLSASAEIGKSCLNDKGCDDGEICSTEIVETFDTVCNSTEQCAAAGKKGADIMCNTDARKCVRVKGQCLAKGDAPVQPADSEPLEATPPSTGIRIPGFGGFSEAKIVTGEDGRRYATFPWIGEYFSAVYTYLLGITGLIVLMVFMTAGFEYLTSGGNQTAVSRAKERMKNATLGMLLMFGSYTILSIINPDLVRFKGLRVQILKNVALDLQAMEEVNPFGGLEGLEDASNAGFNDVKLYKQAGGSWGSKAYGDMKRCPKGKDPGVRNPDCCSSFAWAGCGPTSLAMVLDFYGFSANPGTVGAFTSKIGARTCNRGTNGTMVTEITKNPAWRAYGLKGEKTNHSKALALLKEGKPIIATTPKIPGCYKRKGHWIVLTGVDENGIIRVNDPATGRCFKDRDSSDGFMGRRGDGLTGMTLENFNKIPGVYYVSMPAPQEKTLSEQHGFR